MGVPTSTDKWIDIVQECRSSGLSDREWCREHKIAESTFYYNIRRLRKRSCSIPERRRRKEVPQIQEVIPLTVSDDEGFAAPGAPVSRDHTPDIWVADTTFRIECHGIAVTLPENIAPETICSVVRALCTVC